MMSSSHSRNLPQLSEYWLISRLQSISSSRIEPKFEAEGEVRTYQNGILLLVFKSNRVKVTKILFVYIKHKNDLCSNRLTNCCIETWVSFRVKAVTSSKYVDSIEAVGWSVHGAAQAADLPGSLYSRGTAFRCWEMRENEGRVKASHGTPPQVPHTKTLISSALGGLSPSPPTPCSLHSLNCGVILIHLINYLHTLQRLRLPFVWSLFIDFYTQVLLLRFVSCKNIV